MIAGIDTFEFGAHNVDDLLQALEIWLNALCETLQSHRFVTRGLHAHSALAREAAAIDAAFHAHSRDCAQPWASLEAAQSLADSFDDKFMLLVFGKFNAGKSAFCNFIAERFVAHGKNARYFHVEAGRIVETSACFEEGATETTVRLQGVCLGEKLVLLDTPGLHSVVPENAALTQRFIESADGVIWLTSSTSPGQVQELDDLSRELHRNKPLLPVVTRSDEYDEDEIDGELVRRLCNKSEARRALQEADVQARAQEKLFSMGVSSALLKRPLSVSVHMAREQGFAPVAMNEAGFERLYAALHAIAGPALEYKRRKRAEVALHHLEENVLDALYASAQPLLLQMRNSAQRALAQLTEQQAQLSDAVCQRTLAALPDMLDAHAVERDVEGLVRALTTAIDETFPGCVREYLAEYDVVPDNVRLELSDSVRFEDIVIESGSANARVQEVIGVDYQRLHNASRQAVVVGVRQLAHEIAGQAHAAINQLLDQAAKLDDVLLESKARLMALKDEIRTHAA
ncbi:dynamin family protein [Burkholderia sp. Ax-1719]|uniref:dynamin family protein n=1 Tax=Burkholderia sp. Ax-1719 TaxID=2608334 RepID=UPI001F03BFA8|nr:dynamin family protein [Burkholderia sp. Ax-1719]